ncbi:MAG: DUF1330 domain-containing protein [Pseudomonadota bacterium]
MPKGYWIAHVAVDDLDEYQEYVRRAAKAFEKHGARFLARAGKAEEMEGGLGRGRHVVIEFPSFQAAVDCYHSDEYRHARDARAGVSSAYITVVEGFED